MIRWLGQASVLHFLLVQSWHTAAESMFKKIIPYTTGLASFVDKAALSAGSSPLVPIIAQVCPELFDPASLTVDPLAVACLRLSLSLHS